LFTTPFSDHPIAAAVGLLQISSASILPMILNLASGGGIDLSQGGSRLGQQSGLAVDAQLRMATIKQPARMIDGDLVARLAATDRFHGEPAQAASHKKTTSRGGFFG